MRIDINDTQVMLRDSARDVFSRDRKLSSATERQDLWKTFADLGWIGAALPEELGGSGGSLLDAGVIAAEMGRGGAFGGFAETVAIGFALAEQASALSPSGETLLIDLLEGRIGLCFPLSLESDDSSGPPQSAVDPADSGTGNALAVVPFAPTVLILGLVDGNKLVLRTLNSASTRPVKSTTHNDAVLVSPVAGSNTNIGPLAEGADGRAIWLRAQLIYRCLAAIQLAGAGRRLVEVAIEYSRVRAQFGQLIGSFQAVQHAIVEEFAAVEASELIISKALTEVITPQFDPVAVHSAIAFAREAVWTVLMKSYDVLGGVGFMEEHPISQYTRSMLPMLASLGTAEQCESATAETVQKGCWLS